jgi:hypothetical protein
MTKLSQIIAIEKGVKNQTTRVETDLYHSLEKKPLFAGLSRRYTPKDEEDGDRLPSEQVAVQIKSEDVLTQLIQAVTRLIDVTATKDASNTFARADITVDGNVIALGVPVTTLMFLEKELEKLAAFVGRIPVLDPTQSWTYDTARGVYASAAVQTVRTKKIPRNHVLYEATKEHPAQVQMFTEDVIVGTWEKVEFSGALPADRIAGISSRLDRLRTAIKFAREEANAIDVVDVYLGADFLSFLFEGGS